MTQTNETSLDNIKTQIYELYTDIKDNLTPQEKEKINNNINQEITSSSDIQVIIKDLKNYIKFCIEEKKMNNNKNNEPEYNSYTFNQLESYIIKLENDIKYLMKKHFQNKIHRDSLEMKIRAYIQIEEEYEELKEKVKYEDGKFLDNDRKDNEIIILRRENSNLKKEISKLEEETKELSKLQEQNKELEKKHNNNENIIKGLKFKIKQLNFKIKEIEEERNITKNNNKTFNEKNSNNNENNLKMNNINDSNNHNTRNKIDFYNISGRKVSLEKFTLNNKNNNIHLKHGTTNYKLPSNMFNYEQTKNNNNNTYSMRTIDTNKLIVSTYNKIYNNSHKKVIVPLRNEIYKKTKNLKSTSVPMKMESEQSELMSKYLSGSNTNNNYITYIKSKSMNKIGKNIPSYLPLSNSSIGKKYLNRDGSNPYEHSALNIVGISKKI